MSDREQVGNPQTEVTMLVAHSLKAQEPLRESLLQADCHDKALSIVTDYVQHVLPFHMHNGLANELTNFALRWVDWEVVLSSLVVYFNLNSDLMSPTQGVV